MDQCLQVQEYVTLAKTLSFFCVIPPEQPMVVVNT